jgi:hypothetical protein
MSITIKRAVCLSVWRILPLSVKSVCIRRHRAKLTLQLASGVRRSDIKSFL